jgi:heme-degrading monooxygenase HmoA
MSGIYASGNWTVREGSEEDFIARWKGFLGWTRESQPGLISANLLRDEQNPRHFVSFAEWEDTGARERWRQSPEFEQKFTACRDLCDEFYGADYQRAAAV